ncbi:MAG: ThiF family adenylyltransferase [Pseudomonadota bacterium]
MKPSKPNLPRNVRWEIARLAQFRPVALDSISFAEHPSGRAALSFDLKTDVPIEDFDTPIQEVEPVIFQYGGVAEVGRIAPIVLSARTDFPRNLPHINPGSRSQPVSLCVARAGHQAVYDRLGVIGIVARTLSWLNDAKAGNLYEDGWDPVPYGSMKDGAIGYVEAGYLQDFAAANPDGGLAFSAATITHAKNDGVFVHAEFPMVDTNDVDALAEVKTALRSCNADSYPFKTYVPVIFVWPERDRIELDSHFNEWQDMQSLIDGLTATSLRESLDTAFIKLDVLFGEDSDFDMNGNRAFVLLIGLWRPVALDPTIVGLSDNDNARCLELRSYYLVRDRAIRDRWALETNVRPFFGLVSTLPETLEAVSGEDALNHTVILGAGALGSAFLSFLVRAGGDHVTVADDDLLASHNMARHRATRRDIGRNKAELCADLSQEWAQDVQVSPITADLTSMSDEDFNAMLTSHQRVWDATANPLVRRRLSSYSGSNIPLARTEIFHGGRLGVTLLTETNNSQSLNHLYHQLIALAVRDGWIRDWLAYESTRSFLDDELLLGFGCQSLTTKMPAYKVDSHASASFAMARHWQASDNAKIGLHRLTDTGLSEGTRVIEADPVVAFQSRRHTNRWAVRVAQTVLERMHELRIAAAPNETGGYLFGAIDEDLSQIHVVAASPEPPGTTASPTDLQLGPWGQTGFEKNFMRRTQGRLPPIGTWHSHPASSPKASAKDRKTVESFKLEDALKGLPTVMAITGAESDAVYVLEP